MKAEKFMLSLYSLMLGGIETKRIGGKDVL